MDSHLGSHSLITTKLFFKNFVSEFEIAHPTNFELKITFRITSPQMTATRRSPTALTSAAMPTSPRRKKQRQLQSRQEHLGRHWGRLQKPRLRLWHHRGRLRKPRLCLCHHRESLRLGCLLEFPLGCLLELPLGAPTPGVPPGDSLCLRRASSSRRPPLAVRHVRPCLVLLRLCSRLSASCPMSAWRG